MTRRITWPAGGSNGSAALVDVDDGIALPATTNGPIAMERVTGLVAAMPTIPQPAIPDVATGQLVLLSDVITATNAIRATLNTLLAELRTAGILLP